MSEVALASIRLEAKWLPEAALWAEGMAAKLPQELADLLTSGALAGGDPVAREVAVQAAHQLRARCAFLSRPTAASRLPISYTTVPPRARRVLAKVVGRLQRHRQSRWADFPTWPLDLSADISADLGASEPRSGRKTPVFLTHDIDSPEGLSNLVEYFLPIEEGAGCRSANYVVPCAWPADPGLMRDVWARGHEIGIHGYDHAGRTSFATKEERTRRLAEGRVFGDIYGAKGYRSPSLIRSEDLLSGLQDIYEYDSSIPTSGGLFPAPNNGCASARPWRIGSIWEVPLSLPRDGSLRFLGYDAEDIGAMWWSLSQIIARSGGVVNLLTHCENGFSGNRPMLKAYREFVERIATDERFEVMLPADFVASLRMSG